MQIEEILRLAKEIDASDIHMAPGSPLMFRINGKLVPQDMEIMKPKEVEEAILPVMNEEQLQELERKKGLDFAFSIPGFSRVRVNIFSQRGTYAASLRILSYDVPTPESLGIPKPIVEMTKRKRGLILVSGAAGSGKSTTLASLIDVMADSGYRNIITIENPIEYLHSHKKSIVSQREVGSDTTGYAEGIRDALRQDPDVIMVGDLYDMETISMALVAAETGHLVLSTLHTGSAVDAIDRMVDVFPPYQQQQIRVQLASVLNGIVVQQLLPRSDEKGRIAAFEVLLANEAVRTIIRDGKNYQLPNLMANSRKEGMQSMDDAILDAYMRSQIAMDTAVSFAQDGDSMERKVRIF